MNMEYCREFQLTLISASDLEDVRNFFAMKVHARVSIGGDLRTETRTPTDTHGGTNPAWNYPLQYKVGVAAVHHHDVMVVIKLYCSRNLGDRYIGEVHAPMKYLFESAHRHGGSAVFDYPIQRGSEPSKGSLRFGCRFGEVVIVQRTRNWGRLLQSGAVVLLRLTMLTTVGLDIPVFL